MAPSVPLGSSSAGTKNDRSVRYSLGRSTPPMAVAAYTYDKLPVSEQKALPDEGHLVAALELAEPDTTRGQECLIYGHNEASGGVLRLCAPEGIRPPKRGFR